MVLGELFTDSTRPKYVEVGAGLLIDGKPVPSGVRVRVPADVAAYLIAQRWAREVDRGHRTPRGVLEWHPVGGIPGVGVNLDEWPSHMRPLWMRAEGRVKRSAGLPHTVPTYCARCERVAYQRQRDDAESARGVQRVVCNRCIESSGHE